MNNESTQSYISDVLIIGGGFAGVRCALDLSRKRPDLSITIVSKGSDFIYYPAMYRFVHGAPRSHVAVPFATLFKKAPSVTCISDTIKHFDPKAKTATGDSGAVYSAERIILAVGSENNYFRIEGVGEVSFNFKSLEAAYNLRERIAKLFAQHVESDTAEMLVALHFVIVGGGASGVELAGELATYTKELARFHNLPESLVTIDIVERNPRLLKRLDERVSRAVEKRLRTLGVNVLLNRSLVKSESWTTYLGDMTLGAKTVIWTAGVRPASLSQEIEGFPYTERGKVMVSESLEIEGLPGVFVAGDITDRPGAGLAQTALEHGNHIARIIAADLSDRSRPTFRSKEHWHVLPIGPWWGALQYRSFVITGRIAWIARFMADIRFFLSVLPIREVMRIFRASHRRPHLDNDSQDQ